MHQEVEKMRKVRKVDSPEGLRPNIITQFDNMSSLHDPIEGNQGDVDDDGTSMRDDESMMSMKSGRSAA